MGALSLHIRLFGLLELALGDEPPEPGLTQDRVEAQGDGGPAPPSSPTARALLSYLILHRRRRIPRDRLLGLYWPDRPNARARRALSNALWQIRKALGPAADRLVTAQDTVAFEMQPGDWLDVESFETGVKQSGALSGPSRLRALAGSIQWYRADFLPEMYADWALVERERLRELYLRALERLITLHKQRGDYDQALTYAQRLVASDPLREAAHRELMRLYHLVGRPRAAVEQFATLYDLLAEELGVSPTPTTVGLREEIAIGLEELGPPHLPLAPSPPPLLRELAYLPFVGRNRERTALIEALQAANRGHGGVALVEGEAGVGKTRLTSEIVAGARWRGFQVGLSKADSLVAPAPYQLLRDALSPLLTPLRAAQLAELVDPHWLAVSAPILPALAEQPGELTPIAPLGPAEERQRLCQGLIHCVAGLASAAPLLLVLEDVHWADLITLEALPTLAPGVATGRVLVVLTCRSAEARTRQDVWEALEALDRALPILHLGIPPFDRSETVSLVQRALGVDEGDARAIEFGRRLQDETGGNALFLVESLESLLEQETLSLVEGRWRFPMDNLSLPPPASLQDVIGTRFERLSPALQAVLEHVAVLGGDAEFPVLSATVGAPAVELTRQLRQLDKRGFLRETNTGYAFPHDVIRDVVYQAIPLPRRRALHRRAGAAVEEIHPDRVESLAVHFERGGVWSKAVHRCRQAGQRARAVYASGQAIAYYDRALRAWRRMEERDAELGQNLHRERGRICQDRGWFDRAEADFQAARELAEDAGDRAGQARILNHLSYLKFQRGDFKEAAEIAQRGLALGRDADCEAEIATALFNQANALRNLGDYPEAIDLYEQAATLFERLDDQRRLADCLNRMGAAFNHVGDFLRARGLIRRSLTIRRRLGDKVGISYSLINLALSRYLIGQFDGVQEAAQEALEIATAIGDPYGRDAALHDLGMAALEQGLAAEAIPLFEGALAIAREIGDKALEPETLTEMGRAYQQMGALERARELLEQALDLVSISVERNYVPAVHAYLAALYLEMGRADGALRHARIAVHEAEEQGDLWAAGLSHRVMGQVLERAGPEGSVPEAAAHLERGIQLQREIGARAELARSLAAHALHLRRLKDRDEAQRSEPLLEQARRLFQELGMGADLARLDRDQAARLLPDQVLIWLPSIGTLTSRSPSEDHHVEVIWTVAAPEDERISGRVARRRHRVLRLLHEAAERSAAPTVEHLADALEVSARTIKRDLAALRAEGHDVRTRGSRAEPV
jgi:DNA-binding SARP family transcriptional activator